MTIIEVLALVWLTLFILVAIKPIAAAYGKYRYRETAQKYAIRLQRFKASRMDFSQKHAELLQDELRLITKGIKIIRR